MQTELPGASSRADARIVRRVLRGDPEAFEKLVLRHQKRACAVALAAGAPADQLHDVLSGAFLQALRSLPALRRPEAFGPWFLAIVRNAARRLLRDARRSSIAPPPEPRTESYADAFERSEFNAYIRERVQDLPVDVREAILLYYYEGESVRSVARTLGTTSAAIKNRLHRGRQLLREKLWREVGDSLRDMLPSAREWRRGARRLSLVALAALPCGPARAAAASSAAPAGAQAAGDLAGASPGNVAAGGGLLVSTKKITLVVLACVLIFFPLGFSIGHRIVAPPRESRLAAADPDALSPPPSALPRGGAAGEPRAAAGEAAAVAVPAPHAAAAATGDLRVRVVWEESGDPAVGLRVFAVPLPERRPVLSRHDGVTGDDGAATLARLPPGELRVEAYRASVRRGGGKRARVRAGETTTVLLELPSGHSASGIVVDAAGRPVAGAEIWLSEGMFNSTESNLVAHAAADGTFTLRGVERGRSIGARAAGWAPSSQKVVSGEDGEEVSLRLVLPGPGGAIDGLVVDEGGHPVGAALVVLGERHATATYTAPPAPVRLWTDEGGAFAAAGLPAGRVPIVVRGAGSAPAEALVEIAPQGTARVEVVLGPGVTVRGRVVSPAGEPVPGAKVRVGDEPEGYARPDVLVTEARTEPDGRYRLAGLAPGELKVQASADGRGFASRTVAVAPGGELEVDLELSGPLEIRGRVVLEDERPLSRAMVSPLGLATVFTDRDGRFVLENARPQGYRIDITESGHRFPCLRLDGVSPDAAERTITVPEASRSTSYITGRVLGPDGSSMRGAHVECFGEEPRGSARARSGLLGGFRLGPLPPGTFELHVSAEGYPRVWSGKIEVGRGATAGAGDLRLQEPGFLKTVFVTADPGAVDGLHYSIVDAEDRALLVKRLAAEASTRDAVIPGRHRLRVRRDGTEIERPCEIRAGEETVLEIEPPPRR